MEPGKLDLERLGLRSGQATSTEFELRPESPRIGGQAYEPDAEAVAARVEVSKTTAGHAFRLTAAVKLHGPCARCLDSASLPLAIEAREVDQTGAEESELNSPYVEDAILDAGSWLHDAIVLALPEKILCRPDCAGICEVCGAALNDLEPGTHTHERSLDPRFAKLRELSGE